MWIESTCCIIRQSAEIAAFISIWGIYITILYHNLLVILSNNCLKANKSVIFRFLLIYVKPLLVKANPLMLKGKQLSWVKQYLLKHYSHRDYSVVTHSKEIYLLRKNDKLVNVRFIIVERSHKALIKEEHPTSCSSKKVFLINFHLTGRFSQNYMLAGKI